MKDVIKLLDRIGSIGALLAAAAAPCCFPLFAAVAAASGLTVFGRFETTVLYIFQGFALVAILGLALNYPKHRRFGPLALGILSGLALAYVFYCSWNVELLYAGLFGIVIASVWNWSCGRGNAQQPLLQSIVTCPKCGHRTEEVMPTNACVFFFECPACGEKLKPKRGDCCVFCSYGSVPCPPIQTASACCS